jgi:hypothetical protein
VVPTLIRVLDTDASLLVLESSATNSVTPDLLDQACDLLLQFTSELLNRVEQEHQKCPLAIREAVAMIQKATLGKFPSLKCIGTSVLFLRYIGPCLIQPKVFGLEVGRAISNDHLKALVNISKLLQTTSNGIVKNTVTTYAAHDNKIKKFVESKLEQMTQIGNKIMNEQQIETLKSLIDTDNALLPAFAEQIKDEALTKLYDGLMQNRPNIVRSRSDSQWQTARGPSNGTIVRSSTTMLSSKKFSEKRLKNKAQDKDIMLNFLQTIGKALRRQSSSLSKSEGSLLDTFKLGLDVLLNMCEIQFETAFKEEDLLVSPSIIELAPLFSAMKNSTNNTVQFSPLFSVTAPRKIRFSKHVLRLLLVVGVLTLLNANSAASVFVSVQSSKEREDSSDSTEDDCEVRLSLQFTESRPANVDTDVFLGSSPSKRLTEAHSACLAPLASLFDDYHIESRFYEVNGSVALSLVIPTIDIRSAMDVAEKKTLLDQLMAKSPATWTSTDVFHYLECHGLGAYGSSFVSNSISGPELLRLEADDLREIGVKKLGPLKKILSLITSLAPNKNSESEEERPAAQIQTYPIKCFYEEEIRVVKLSTDLTLGQIQEKLRSLFSENIRIKFKDSDDDLVKLSETSFEHYRETVQSALKTQQSVPVYISEARSRASSSSSRSSKSLPHDLLQCEDPTEALIVTTKQGSVQYMNDVATELLGLGSRRYDRFVFSNYFSHSFEQLQQMYTDFIHENPALEYMVVQDSVAAKTGFENVVLNVSTVALPKSKIAHRFSFKITKDAGHEHVSTLQQIREKITKEKHPVVLFDGSYKVQAFNKSATDTFGYKLHEIVGKDVGILFPHTPLEEIVRHTRSMPRSVISQDKNGGLLNLSITTSSMVDGNTKYYSVVFSN